MRTGAAVLPFLTALVSPAAFAKAFGRRELSMANTHTGETLDVVYYAGGRYRHEALHRANHLLRDFRTGDVHAIDPHALDILYALQVLANRGDSFEVISGYRSPRTNAMLRATTKGVALHSLHMQGRAIDVRLPGFPTRKLRDLAISLRRGGVGYYRASDFVHVDTGRVRHW